MKIEITQDNINNAVKKNSHRCMIADAIQKEIDWAKYIMVDLQSIRFSDVDKGIRYFYLTPPKAQKELLNFDQGKKIKPFILNLIGAIKRINEKNANIKSKTKKSLQISSQNSLYAITLSRIWIKKIE